MAKSVKQHEEQFRWLDWERWAFLLGRLVIIFSMVYVPLVFYTGTWHHYGAPKNAAMQFFVLVALVCFFVIAMGKRVLRSPLASPLGLYLVMVLFTTLVAVNMAEAWEQLTFEIACVLLALLASKFITRLRDFEALIYVLGFLCIAVDVYALVQQYGLDGFYQFFPYLGQYVSSLDRYVSFTSQPVSFMGNRNYAAEFLNLTTPVCALMILVYLRYPAQLVFFSLVTLLNVVTINYIDCNATFMGIAVATPITLVVILYYKVIPWLVRIRFFPNATRQQLEVRCRKLIVLAVLGIAILGVFIASTDNKIRQKANTIISWVDVNGDNRPDGIASIIFRLQCMDASIRKIADMPWLGIGAGNFKVAHPLYETQLERKVLGEETLARKAHNDHLQHAAEYGLFGTFAWYWVIATVFYMGFRSFKLIQKQILCKTKEWTGPKPAAILLKTGELRFYFYLQLGLISGIVVALVDSFFGHTFVITSSALVIWLWFGVAAAVYQRLSFADRGVAFPFYSYRQDEQPHAVREQTKKVPGWARWILLFALLLPLGSWNTYQMVGEGYLKRGMDYHSVNDYSMMFHSFDKAMEIYPYQMEIYYILGRYYIDTLVLMDQAVMKGQEGIDQLTALGLDIRKRSDINDRGIVCLQTDLFMNPNYKWAHNNLGVLYDRYAYPAKYPSYFDPYIEINPENNMYRYVSLSAKSTYDRVLKIDDEQVYAHYNMGLGYMNQGHYNLAIDELGRALVSDPSKPDTYRFLASCFISNADPVRAFAATDKYAAMVLLSKKDQILAHANQTENTDLVQSMNLVIDSLNKRQLDQAMEILAQQGIQWADEDIFKLYLRIANDLTSGETPSPQYAVLALYRAEKVMLNPSAEFLNLAAQIYLKNGAYEKAGEKLQEMLRYQPDNVDIRRQLAQIYLALSQFNLARSVFEQVLKLEPNSWENHVSYARILIANQVPWEKVFPFVARAIELGGDAAKAEIGKKDESNLIAPIIDQDSRLQSLLGVAPAASEPAAATAPVAVTEPAIPATAETTPATPADSAPADSVQPGTPE